MELVAIDREKTKVKLFDTKGGEVTLYKSLTIDQQSTLMKKFQKIGTQELTADQNIGIAIETVVQSFVDWNLGKNGVKLECTAETLGNLTQRDFFALIQGCTGRMLLDEQGNLLTDEQASKKGKSA